MFYQIRFDAEGGRRFTYLSESVPRLYGVSVAEAIADPDLVYRRIHPDDLGPLLQAETVAARNLAPFRAEARVLEPDGGIRWSSFVSTPTGQPDGSVHWDGVEFIITDRKRSEEALRESEAQIRSLVSAIPDLLFTFSRDGTCQTVHASAPELLLAPSEQVVGRTVDHFLPGPLVERLRLAIAAALDGGTVQELDYALELGGEQRFFEARLARATADRVIALVRDVTRSRRLEEEQQRLQARLVQAQKLDSLGSLAGGVAHDMNNVLGAILAIASYNLEVQQPGSPTHKAFDTIAKAATRGGEMVRNLLNFARQTPVQTRPVDLNGVLREVIQLLERTTLAKVRLEADLEEKLRPIQGDPGALANAFMNLAVNGVDAMGGGGTLSLRTRNREDGWVEAVVQDTGVGMSPEVLQKALDPFFTTKETGKGTGLGLAMVYGTVKAHQGRLELHSEAGQGTRVALRFPAAGPAQPAPAPAAAGTAGAAPDRMKVLLVDDDPDMNDSLGGLLDLLGHQTEAVTSGEAALAQLERGYRPDLVFLDVNMPGLGGLATLPRLRRILPAVPVVLVTGKADQAALDLVRANSRVTLLPKPFTLDELRRHLG
jgi:PAS domain S-box-containing protein